jgi:hypothetical protein
MTEKAEFIISAKDKTAAVLKKTERTLNDIAGTALKLGGVLGGISFAGVAAGIFKTTAQMEKLKASLKTVTGSTENANLAFEGILDFTKSTPFQLEETTSAFIKLKALGLEPSERALRSYGNTASAMGKSLDQMIEAVADATTGEFERLKEFGIKASSQGDNVAFTFQGVTTTVRKNATEIEEYLTKIGETQFAGAMEEQMNTLTGVMSNLQDTVTQLLNGEGDGLESLKTALKDLTNNLSDPKTKQGIQDLVTGFVTFAGTMVKITAEIPAFTQFLGEMAAKKVAGSDDPIERIDEQIQKLTQDANLLKYRLEHSGVSLFGSENERVSEELERVTSKIVELRTARAQFVEDINNKPVKSPLDNSGQKSKLDQLAEQNKPANTPGVSGGLTDQKIQDQLDKLQTFLMSEHEIENEALNRRQQMVFDARERGLISEQQYKELMQGLELKHQEKLNELMQKGLTQREKFQQLSTKAKTKFMIDETIALTQGVAQQNKTLFKINKLATLAQIAVDAPKAISQSIANAGGLPWGAWAGILTFAKYVGLAQAAKGVEFGAGNSAPSLAGQGGGSSTVNTVPLPQQQPVLPDLSRQSQQAQRTVNITISGPVDRQFLKDALLPALQEEIDENDVTFISAGSAQARELRRA